jgi:hypothetical protein
LPDNYVNILRVRLRKINFSNNRWHGLWVLYYYLQKSRRLYLFK